MRKGPIKIRRLKFLLFMRVVKDILEEAGKNQRQCGQDVCRLATRENSICMTINNGSQKTPQNLSCQSDSRLKSSSEAGQ